MTALEAAIEFVRSERQAPEECCQDRKLAWRYKLIADAYIEQLDAQQPWLGEAIAQIRALSTLDANWDSYGAEPVSPGAIERAIVLLTTMAKDSTLQKPGISATPDGRVALVWDDLDIAIGAQQPKLADVNLVQAFDELREASGGFWDTPEGQQRLDEISSEHSETEPT